MRKSTMKKNTFFILLLSLMTMNLAISVLGDELLFADKEIIVNQSWFSATPTEFNGHPLDAAYRYDRLNVHEGGEGMTNFINHGRIAYDEDNGTAVYLAEMTFPFYTSIFTDCAIDDIFNHHTADVEKEWLRLVTYTDWYAREGEDVFKGIAKWKNIEIDDYESHEYDGAVKISTQVRPNLPISEGDVITIGGTEFRIPDIDVYVNKVVVADRKIGVADDPNQNFYTSEVNVIPVDTEAIDRDVADDGRASHEGAVDACGDGATKNNGEDLDASELIDWAGTTIHGGAYGVTYTSGEVAQSFVSSASVGQTWGFTDDLNPAEDIFDFNVPIRIKPNAFYDVKDVSIKHVKLRVDRKKENLFPVYGLFDVTEKYIKRYERVIGLGVQNMFVKLKFDVQVYMLMEVEAIGEESEGYLEDPEIVKGDILWDNTVRGTTEADVVITGEGQNWWTDIGDWWEDVWSGTGDWFDGIDDWWTDIWEGVGDWWEGVGDWWNESWIWIALIGVVVLTFAVVILKKIYIDAPKQQAQQAQQVSGTVIKNLQPKS